jgi:hypothetical protein
VESDTRAAEPVAGLFGRRVGKAEEEESWFAEWVVVYGMLCWSPVLCTEIEYWEQDGERSDFVAAIYSQEACMVRFGVCFAAVRKAFDIVVNNSVQFDSGFVANYSIEVVRSWYCDTVVEARRIGFVKTVLDRIAVHSADVAIE